MSSMLSRDKDVPCTDSEVKCPVDEHQSLNNGPFKGHQIFLRAMRMRFGFLWEEREIFCHVLLNFTCVCAQFSMFLTGERGFSLVHSSAADQWIRFCPFSVNITRLQQGTINGFLQMAVNYGLLHKYYLWST